MTASVSPFLASLYIVAAIVVFMLLWTAVTLAHAVVDAVLVARRYYRENPNAAAPTEKLFVRIGLWGVR